VVALTRHLALFYSLKERNSLRPIGNEQAQFQILATRDTRTKSLRLCNKEGTGVGQVDLARTESVQRANGTCEETEQPSRGIGRETSFASTGTSGV
jgi:hypothetical protein